MTFTLFLSQLIVQKLYAYFITYFWVLVFFRSLFIYFLLDILLGKKTFIYLLAFRQLAPILNLSSVTDSSCNVMLLHDFGPHFKLFFIAKYIDKCFLDDLINIIVYSNRTFFLRTFRESLSVFA